MTNMEGGESENYFVQSLRVMFPPGFDTPFPYKVYTDVQLLGDNVLNGKRYEMMEKEIYHSHYTENYVKSVCGGTFEESLYNYDASCSNLLKRVCLESRPGLKNKKAIDSQQRE